MTYTLTRGAVVAGGFALALFSIQPTLACHRYRHWAYPWPQSCGAAAAPARVPTMHVVETPLPTIVADADQAEHDAAVAAHHDEINALMLILRTNEALGR